MDRLETETIGAKTPVKIAFTFQYGQIRNLGTVDKMNNNIVIYIPVWIDQKLLLKRT